MKFICLAFLLLSACARVSPPAYPAWVGKVPCTWYEGGKVWHVPPEESELTPPNDRVAFEGKK